MGSGCDREALPGRRAALRPRHARPRWSGLSAYVDSSALVAALGREVDSDDVRATLAAIGPASTSRLTFVEVHAALASARRGRRISVGALARARSEFDELWRSFFVLDVDASMAVAAADVADRFALRSHDAVQLASALALQDPDVTMVALDKRLLRAAADAGLSVAP
ncbi:MAG: type II toxin-antitoxin system VapC family toxin [Actinobacteria bacterium]|nr:type II toxin-antitoxin system VapC family toxin [Actinomycetota bacterium]